jgi:ribonuclease-3
VERDLSEFKRKLRYEFQDHRLVEEALRHSSFVNEQNDTAVRDNERLEFLGDAVLNLVVGDILMKRFPDLKEGHLTRMRANLVNESQLALIAQTIDLGLYILLGKGETQTNGGEKKSILADALEAVIAAVYSDGGFEAAYKTIECHFSKAIDSITTPVESFDYKSRLQEKVQSNRGLIPLYRVINETGPDHDKTFFIQVAIRDLKAEGSGKNKKMAEQDAAKKALEILARKTNGTSSGKN